MGFATGIYRSFSLYGLAIRGEGYGTDGTGQTRARRGGAGVDAGPAARARGTRAQRGPASSNVIVAPTGPRARRPPHPQKEPA